MRTSGQREKIEQFQSQIYGLEKEISEIEYQISKLKYF
jgi:peptidoglycan hydrolase CwlO-like protein